MSSWSNLSQNLNQESTVASLATLVAGVAETYTAEELNLNSHFSNSMTWSNLPDYQKDWNKDFRSSDSYWNAGLDWDLKGSFAWNIKIGVMEEEVHTLILNPYVDVYGYIETFFDFYFPYGMIGVTLYVQPS